MKGRIWPVFRSILSILAGYIFMAVCVIMFYAVAPKNAILLQSTNFLLVTVAFGMIVAIVGGIITSVIAKTRVYLHVGILAVFIGALSFINIISVSGKEPLWFQIANPVFAVIGVFLGGAIKKKLM